MFAFDSPAGRLLRAASSPAGSDADDACARLVAGGIDWDRFLATARAHGVGPLVARRLIPFAPESPREHLRNELRRSVASALLQERVMREALDLAREAGIDALVLKGQVLSREAWGETGLRLSVDVDILVRHRDAEAFADVLRRAGYEPAMSLTPAEWRRVLRTHPEWSFGREGTIDLHWALVSREAAFDLEVEELFASARAIDVGAVPVPTLATTHLVLFLAVHGCKHFWERFEWIASFHAIASREGVDWDCIWNLARTHRAARRLSIALHLASRCFGTTCDAPADDAVRDNVAWTVSHWFDRSPAPAGGAERQRVAAPTFDTRRDAARSWLAAVFEPRVSDWRETPLPDVLAFLYPLLRPVRLALRGRRR